MSPLQTQRLSLALLASGNMPLADAVLGEASFILGFDLFRVGFTLAYIGIHFCAGDEASEEPRH
jgi:hypothetical protein